MSKRGKQLRGIQLDDPLNNAVIVYKSLTSHPVSEETSPKSKHIHSEEGALNIDKLRQNLSLPSQWTPHDNDIV